MAETQTQTSVSTAAAMESIHAVNMRLLLEWDRVCRAHGISYFLDSGTLLGAVRGGDFIPWDDDVDIMLKREDFEKFLRVKDEMTDPFEVVRPEDYPRSFFDPITKVSCRNSRIRPVTGEERFYHDYPNRINADLFPLDHLGDGWKGRMQIAQLKLLYAMAMSRRYRIRYARYSPVQRPVIFLLTLAGRLIPLPALLRAYRRVACRYDSVPTRRWFSPYYPQGDMEKALLPDWFDGAVEVKLRGQTFPAPRGWDALLRRLYGDYRQLPPEDQRVPQHVAADQLKIW